MKNNSLKRNWKLKTVTGKIDAKEEERKIKKT